MTERWPRGKSCDNGQNKLKEMWKGEGETGDWQMKCKTGQTETVGHSYARADLQVQKQHNEE
jgi:hypothetical protein